MIRSIQSIDKPRTRRFCVEEYHRLSELGFFDNQRVELIDGEIFEMSPQNSPHATGLSLAIQALGVLENNVRYIRSQLPLALNEFQEPEPDLALVVGTPRDYVGGHPETALFIVEVADSSLEFDRTAKAQLYARAPIPEYWILNLIDRVLEVHRQPTAEGYSERTTFSDTQSVSPLIAPEISIKIASLLP